MQNPHKKTFTLFPVKITSSQSDFMLKCSNFILLFATCKCKQLASRPNQTEVCAILLLRLKKTMFVNRIYLHTNHCLFGQTLSFYNSMAKALLHACNTGKKKTKLVGKISETQKKST